MSIFSDFLGRMTCQANGPGRCRAGLVGLLEGNLAAAFAQQVKPRPPPMQHLQLDTGACQMHRGSSTLKAGVRHEDVA